MQRKTVMMGALTGLLAVSLSACAVGGETAAEGTAAPAQGAVMAAQQVQQAQQTQPSPTPIAIPTVQIALGVSGVGEVKPEQDADLVFQVQGIVAEVRVEEGQAVKKGDELAALDPRTFDAQLQQAEAGLQSAQAALAGLGDAPKSADVAAANAQVAQAQAGLQNAQAANAGLQEKPKSADVAAAEAQIAQAQANLQKVLQGANTKQKDIENAQAAYTAAQANLQTARDRLSQAKTQAESQLEQATNVLTSAQAAYQKAKSDWEYVQETGQNPVNPSTVNPTTGEKSKNKLTDSQREQYYAAFVQSEAALRQAEESVNIANVNAEQARRAEVTGIAAADQQTEQARIALERVQLPTDPNDVDSARAALAAAQANRNRLNPAPTNTQRAQAAAAVAQAQAVLRAAQANRNKLNPDPTNAQQVQAQAAVAQAEANLKTAQVNRERAAIVAPFDGVIAAVNIDPGDPSSQAGAGNEAVIKIVDVSKLHIDVQISDLDVGKIKVGQTANIRLDALPSQTFTGKVTYIAPTATVTGNVRTYLVRVVPDSLDGFRVGLSARVEFPNPEE